MISPDEVIWCLADILVPASPWLCPLKAANHSPLLPLSWSATFHRSIKGKGLLVPSQMMYTRAFHDFNSRAADVTTQRDPQVNLFPFCTLIFLSCMYFNLVLKSASKVVSSIIWFITIWGSSIYRIIEFFSQWQAFAAYRSASSGPVENILPIILMSKNVDLIIF